MIGKKGSQMVKCFHCSMRMVEIYCLLRNYFKEKISSSYRLRYNSVHVYFKGVQKLAFIMSLFKMQNHQTLITFAIYLQFQLLENESLVSPVVEYIASTRQEFLKSVCVQLPHSLPEDFPDKLFKVSLFENIANILTTLFFIFCKAE